MTMKDGDAVGLDISDDRPQDGSGRYTQGFHRPQVTRDVYESVAKLKYLKVDEAGMSVKLSYRGKPMFEFDRNLFYDRAYYGPFYIGGDLWFERLIVLGEDGLSRMGEFEREINLYQKTEEELEERYRKSYEAFKEKMREIEGLAKRALIEDLKGLDLVEACRDFTVFVNAKAFRG